jgi:hypothetical protein
MTVAEFVGGTMPFGPDKGINLEEVFREFSNALRDYRKKRARKKKTGKKKTGKRGGRKRARKNR